MTRVCLLGAEDVDIRPEIRTYETARHALSSYELSEPYENSLCVETISIGAAVSLLNDLNWYLVRLVSEALVLEPSVSETEWLTRDLATAIRNDEVDPAETGDLLKVYGVVEPEPADGDARPPSQETGTGTDSNSDEGGTTPESSGLPRLTTPMYVQRVGDEVPAYDLEEVDDTLVVRVTAEEFGA